MCVIIYKAKGVEPMTNKEIGQAWNHNPDGAGLWHNGKVFKSMDEKAFKERCKLIKKDDEAVYHFRIATTGKVRKANCHPFNIGTGILFHNGVLPFKPKEDITDSEYFGRYILSPALKVWPLGTQEVLDGCRAGFGSSSKLALIRKGKVYLSGYFQDHRGLKCSNLLWVPAPKTTAFGKWSCGNYGSLRDRWDSYDGYSNRVYGYNDETSQYGYWQDDVFVPYAF